MVHFTDALPPERWPDEHVATQALAALTRGHTWEENDVDAIVEMLNRAGHARATNSAEVELWLSLALEQPVATDEIQSGVRLLDDAIGVWFTGGHSALVRHHGPTIRVLPDGTNTAHVMEFDKTLVDGIRWASVPANWEDT